MNELSSDRFATSVTVSASAEKADGEGGRPEGTRTGFERNKGVKRESGFENRGFNEVDGLEMDRARDRKDGRHEKK